MHCVRRYVYVYAGEYDDIAREKGEEERRYRSEKQSLIYVEKQNDSRGLSDFCLV